MHFSTLALPLLAASLPGANAQLNKLAKKAGLKYFGAATDSPGQRERAGFEAAYDQYDAILDDIDEFGQTTPTNGQKVCLFSFINWLRYPACPFFIMTDNPRSGSSSNPNRASSTSPKATSPPTSPRKTASSSAATPSSGTASSPRGSRRPSGPPRNSARSS